MFPVLPAGVTMRKWSNLKALKVQYPWLDWKDVRCSSCTSPSTSTSHTPSQDGPYCITCIDAHSRSRNGAWIATPCQNLDGAAATRFVASRQKRPAFLIFCVTDRATILAGGTRSPLFTPLQLRQCEPSSRSFRLFTDHDLEKRKL